MTKRGFVDPPNCCDGRWCFMIRSSIQPLQHRSASMVVISPASPCSWTSSHGLCVIASCISLNCKSAACIVLIERTLVFILYPTPLLLRFQRSIGRCRCPAPRFGARMSIWVVSCSCAGFRGRSRTPRFGPRQRKRSRFSR